MASSRPLEHPSSRMIGEGPAKDYKKKKEKHAQDLPSCFSCLRLKEFRNGASIAIAIGPLFSLAITLSYLFRPPPSLSLSLSHCHSCPVIGSSRRNSSLQGSKLQWKPDADQARASARSLSAAGRDFVNSSKTKIRVNLISLNEVPIVKSRAAASAGAAPWNKKDKEGVNRRKTRRTRLPLWG
jgi:hypothetical protein